MIVCERNRAVSKAFPSRQLIPHVAGWVLDTGTLSVLSLCWARSNVHMIMAVMHDSDTTVKYTAVLVTILASLLFVAVVNSLYLNSTKGSDIHLLPADASRPSSVLLKPLVVIA